MEETATGSETEDGEGSQGDNQPPVIKDENEPVENPGTEEGIGTENGSDTEDGSEGEDSSDVDPATPEDSFETNIKTDDLTTQDDAAVLAAPAITLKKGTDTIESGAKVPHGTNNVTFELSGPEGADLHYIVGSGEITPNDGNKYTNAVPVTAPTETTEQTVTIKAVAHIPASGEGDSAVAEKTSTPVTATVVFEAKGKTIAVAAGSDSATVKIGDMTVTASDEYPITSAAKDIDVAVAAEGKVFEVMYNVDDGTWTSALKKGQTVSKPFVDRAVSFGSGTYTIPKAALSKDVKIKVCYLREITLDWQGDAGWGSVAINATVQRDGSDSKDWIGVWGAQHAETKKDKEDVLFVPQNTSVNLDMNPVKDVAFTFKTVKAKETGNDGATEIQGTIPEGGKSAALEITAVTNKDYTVTIDGEASSYAYIRIFEKGDESKGVAFNNGTATIEPRKEYTVKAYKAGGKSTYPINDITITCGTDDVATLTELTQDKSGEGESETATGTFTLKAKGAAGGKTLSVAVKDETETLTTVKLAVAPVISKVTVAKATGEKKDQLAQSIGTSVTYALTLDTKEKTSKDELKANVKTGEDTKSLIKNVELKNNKELVIETNAVNPEGVTAKIDIYNDTAKEAGEAEYVITTLTVTAANPAWISKAPTVKLAGSTDIALQLAMTLPAGVPETAPTGTGYWYKVSVKALDYTNESNIASISPLSVSGSDLPEHVNGVQEVYVAADGKTTTEFVQVLNKAFGNGRSEKFDVSVQLVWYTKTETSTVDEVKKPTGADTLIASSATATLKNVATKAPYYADKISLKKTKAASGVYTGQEIAVATVDFGKNTTYTRDGDVKAEVVENTENKVTAAVENGQVKLTVNKEANPGKYTVRVTQTVSGEEGVTDGYGLPAGTHPTSATVQVTVVQGIKQLAASSQAEIYVPAKKASAAAKITVTYNNGKSKPKSTAVNYTLGTKLDNGAFTKAEGSDNKILKWVDQKSLKKGNVTIIKGYAEAAADDKIPNDTFTVEVKAADYEGNNTNPAYVDFKIITKATELGKIVLVQKEEAVSQVDDVTAAGETYKIVADGSDKNAKELTVDEAKKTYVRILTKDYEKKTGIAPTDFVPTKDYTITLSNKKDVSVSSADQSLNATKVVKNVTIKAVTADGGKLKPANDGKVKFSVTYNTVDHSKAKLQIALKGSSDYTDFAADGSYAADGKSAKQVYTVKALEDTAELNNRIVEYKITAGKGVKIVKTYGSLKADVILTAAEGTVNLVGPKKDGKAQTKSYTIKNNVLAKKTAAPKITLKNKEKIYAGYDTTQEITFTVAKGVVADANKIVITAEQDENSQALYGKLTTKEIALGEGENQVTLSDKNPTDIKLTFDTKIGVIKKATLYFDFVKEETSTNNESQSVTTQTVLTKAPASVSVKTELLKKSYKLNTKYTMSAKDLAQIELSGKAEGVEKVEFKKLLKANIKGKINEFTDAFELNGEKTKLVLKDPKKAVNNKTDGNNLTGFVQYEVTYKDGSKQPYTTQITVTVKTDKNGAKPVRTLKADKVSVINVKDETVTLNVKAGKESVALTHVVLGENTSFEMVTPTADTLAAGTVELKLKDALTKPGAQKVTLTVIAADSFAAKSWSSATDEQKKTLLTDYGIEIKDVKIDVKAANVKNKVKIDAKDSGLNFKDTAETEVESKKVYVNSVTYTPTVFAKVSKIEADTTLDSKKNPATPSWITMTKVEGKNQLEITIDQAGYASYVKAGARKDNKGVVTGYPLNGKEVKAVVKFSYAAAGTTVDTVPIKIKPKQLETSVIEGAADPQPPVTEKTVEVTITPASPTVEAGKTVEFTATVTIDGQSNDTAAATVAWKVENATQGGGNLSTNTKFSANAGKTATLTVDEGESATSLTVTATYTADGKTVSKTATVTVTPKTQQTEPEG